MPLHGKIVVIKRSGGDGTEYPLTATCLFGRKPDCDIRIQLPHVSKEHCRIDLNENKEVVLTNLSSVNPTCVNGVVLQQSERLKHGDVITIIDRSFRFEYPPGRTPKKTPSKGGEPETLKVLRDQQVGDKGEKRVSEVSTDPHLKDGTNQENIQQPLEKTVDLESKGDGSLQQSKTDSPFNDLYQMIKKSLDVKTPRKSSVSLLQTPSSRFCTPKPVSERRSKAQPPTFCEESCSAKKEEEEVFTGAECKRSGTPQSGKKQRRSSQLPPAEVVAEPTVEKVKTATESKVTSPRRRTSTTPLKFSVPEVIEQVVAQTPKSPVRRRSKEGTLAKSASPKNPGKSQEKSVSKKRKSGELGTDVAKQQMKRKRVSFGGHLSPELFDKRLPPDSPLRRGATPRRSLSLLKPKNSLLRRASVIGMLKEFDQESPKGKSPAKPKTPSPKKSSASKTASPRTPTPTKKVSKSSSPSPKPASAAKKSPKSASSSPKAATPAKKSPKSASSSPKGATPAKKSPQSKSPSPKGESLTAKSPKPKSPSPAGKRSVAATPAKTPKNSGIPTPTTQGRFSVSRISTPSPTAQVDAVSEQAASVTATPKISLKRKSMKSTTKKTPSISKSAIRVIQRRSGISRASMKVSNCWADIVKFGKPKAQVPAPSQAKPSQKMTKKVVSKPQLKTPTRKLKGHVSTGHADSPATIVVGKAHKRTVTHPMGAAPRVITNIVVLKKNMKMDEDLSGISTMFKTPVNERKRRSVRDAEDKAKTPAGTPVTSVIDPSALDTPEGPGEMMVSPLSIASSVKDRSYNSEAVQRLLDADEESNFVSDIPALETESDAAEQQCTDSKAASLTTPKLKPQTPPCLTGVKRLMKTPREKAKPVEDLMGKLLKTPKQKPEQQECLTGVKRLMKTPREKAEPLEDLRGKLLKTPKQKPEQEECLSGVKRLMKTPRVKAEPVEDLRGKLLKTPKQKPEQEECLSAVKMLMKTPNQKAEPTEDITGKLLTPAAQKPEEQECLSEAQSDCKTPQQEAELLKTPEAPEVDVASMEELLETPAAMEVAKDLSEVMAVKLPNTESSPCPTAVKRIMKTPKEKVPPVEDMVGLKRLMKTPKERGEPVEDKFGLKRLMKSPRLRGNAPVEDFEGLAELMEEPMPEPEEQLETNEDEDQMPVECCEVVAKEPHFPQQDEPSNAVETVDVEPCNLEAPSTANVESSDVKETLNHAAADENILLEAPTSDKVEESLIPQVEIAPGSNSTEVDRAATEPGQKKTARGRRAKVVEAKEEPEAEEPVVPAPVRGRRGKKTEAAAPPAARQTTRGRNAKATESTEAELTVEESAPEPPKPKRGRTARKTTDVPVEAVQEIVADTEKESEAEQSPADVDDSAAPLRKVAAKPKRAGRAKRPEDLVPVQQEVPQADMVQETDVTSASSAEPEVKPSDDLEAEQPLGTESLAAAVQKKPVRGRRGKQVVPKETEDRQEEPEEPAVAAPVRGRRGRKAEAAAPPAVRQRGRSAKPAESAPDQPAVETQPEAEVPTEAASLQTFQKDASQEENVPSEEEAVPKLPRGRRARQTPAEAAQPESEQSESASDEQVLTEDQPEQPAAAKPRRGRKTKADATEQREATEETAVSVETIQQAQPSVRAKRGRNAKLDEVKMNNNAETTESQEPAKKFRKTRKLVDEQVEATEEVQSAEMDHSEKADAPLAEPKTVAAKPKRGRKAEQESESGSTEVAAVISTDKPKRGRRGKQLSDESEVPTETPEDKPEAEELNHEPAAEAVKPSKTRGVKREVPQVVPAKRARRGAAVTVEEGNTESIAPASEPASVPAEPVRRGRRAAVKPTTDEAVGEDAKLSKKSVQWKSDVQVFEISNPTPVKAVRGRKSKSVGKADSESKIPPTEAGRTEEKDLSGETAEAQPTKRARRVAKAADTTADKAETTSKQDAEAEAQPKARRGRPTKK